MNIPITLIGGNHKTKHRMKQKALVVIMHHILHKADYNNIFLIACLLIIFYVKTKTCLETLHNSLKKTVYW